MIDDVVGIDALQGFIAEFHRAFPDFTDGVDRGKIAENRVTWDMYGMLQQPGALPEIG